MNILLIHELRKEADHITFGAVPYYRMQKPHEVLKRMHPEFDYITADSIHIDQRLLDQTDLVIFTRIVKQEDIDILNGLGKTWGIDVDDYWHLPDDHILAASYLDNDIPGKIVNGMKQAHFVMCTTERLAEKIRPINPKVYVIENGIDPEEWRSNKIKSNRVRFGFTQGTTHIPDILTINKDVQKTLASEQFQRKAQVCLCGFNGSPNKQSVYVGYERMLTDDLKHLDPEYRKSLIRFRNRNAINQPYRRIHSVNVERFYYIHNELDVIVAPLKESEFNSCKSNIKMLEAGFMDCAVMVHRVAPYDLDMTDQNCFDLSQRSFFEWSQYILNNPTALEDRKSALKESVQKYSLELLTSKRKELYESISN